MRRRYAYDLATQSGGPVASLTKREVEVLVLVAAGFTNRGIAQVLVVSPATVKAHVEHIIAKLGASNRTQAAVEAVELHLIPNAQETNPDVA